MKSNKGITLTSLVIYVIGLTIVIALIGTLGGYFLKNINEVVEKNNSQEQFSRFLSYITKDINSGNVEFVRCGNANSSYVIVQFNNNVQHQYIYKNSAIYYLKLENAIVTKRITLCNNVSANIGNVFNITTDKKLDYNFCISQDVFSGTLNI